MLQLVLRRTSRMASIPREELPTVLRGAANPGAGAGAAAAARLLATLPVTADPLAKDPAMCPLLPLTS